MPCKKCEDDKYKWGDNGECEYPTKEACEEANAEYKKDKKEYSEAPSPVNYKNFEEYKEAYNKYHKAQEINLSKAQKLELGLIEDAQKIAQKIWNTYTTITKKAKGLSKFEDQLTKINSNFKKLKNDIESKIDEYEKLWNAQKAKTNTALKVAKELGLENDGPIKNLKNNLDDSKKYWNSIDAVTSQINFIKSRLA